MYMAARSEGNGPLDEEELRAAVEASGLSPTRCSALAAPLFAELSLSPHLGSVSDVFQVLVVIEDGLLGRAEAVDLSERVHRLLSANRERRDGCGRRRPAGGTTATQGTACSPAVQPSALERLAWAVLHGRPNAVKYWLELAGPADGGKTMLLETLALVLPGLVKKTNISLFSTAESKTSSGPNEALAQLRGLRISYAEEPAAGLVLDGAFLKDLCGGVQIETSRKYEHQMRFDTTFHQVLICNNETPMKIDPYEGTAEKRFGYRMLNCFTAPDDHKIDNIHVFAREEGLREMLGRDHWVPVLRLLHEHYQQVCDHGFDKTETHYKMDFPPPEQKRGMQYYVGLYEIHEVNRGDKSCLGMTEIYSELEGYGIGGEFTQQQFFSSSFKASMKTKIASWRAAHGISGTGGPRLALPPKGSGKEKFFGIRLRPASD